MTPSTILQDTRKAPRTRFARRERGRSRRCVYRQARQGQESVEVEQSTLERVFGEVEFPTSLSILPLSCNWRLPTVFSSVQHPSTESPPHRVRHCSSPRDDLGFIQSLLLLLRLFRHLSTTHLVPYVQLLSLVSSSRSPLHPSPLLITAPSHRSTSSGRVLRPSPGDESTDRVQVLTLCYSQSHQSTQPHPLFPSSSSRVVPAAMSVPTFTHP